MTTMARWLPVLAIACTGKVEEDDSQPTPDDSSTLTDDTDDSAKDDSGGTTKGDRWDGTYTGGWNLTFDKVNSKDVPGACHGAATVTVDGKDIAVDTTTSGCDGVGVDFYGKEPTSSITDGSIVLDPDFPTNSGTAHFTLVGTGGKKETCSFEFDWTFADNHEPVKVYAEYTLRSKDQFKEFFCAGAGYDFDFQAEQPKKD
jgi:hypothetical protein